MMQIRPAAARGRTAIDWLDSWHSFSFGDYHDSAHVHFGPLRVINEDRVIGGGGFATHGHADMEIVTVVLSGALAHRDSLGNGSVIRPGEVQLMRAGTGIRHSEFNASPSEPVHFLQIWILPRQRGLAPAYAQREFAAADRRNAWQLLLAPQGNVGAALPIAQDARLYRAELQAGQALPLAAANDRQYWLQIAAGSAELAGQALQAGDGVALRDAGNLALHAGADGADLLLFDLPRDPH